MQMQNSVLRGCSHLIRPRTARPTCLRRQLRLRAEEKPSSQKIEERKTIQKKEKLVKFFVHMLHLGIGHYSDACCVAMHGRDLLLVWWCR